MQGESRIGVSKGNLWAGRILSGLVVALMVFTASFGFLKPEMAREGFVRYGYPEGVLRWIVLVELTSAILYAIPRTSILGAILLTGYLGGATATHVRVGERFFLPILVGIVVWLGVYLRDARLQALVPIRK